MNRIRIAIAMDQFSAWSFRGWRYNLPDGPQVRYWRDKLREAAKA